MAGRRTGRPIKGERLATLKPAEMSWVDWYTRHGDTRAGVVRILEAFNEDIARVRARASQGSVSDSSE